MKIIPYELPPPNDHVMTDSNPTIDEIRFPHNGRRIVELPTWKPSVEKKEFVCPVSIDGFSFSLCLRKDRKTVDTLFASMKERWSIISTRKIKTAIRECWNEFIEGLELLEWTNDEEGWRVRKEETQEAFVRRKQQHRLIFDNAIDMIVRWAMCDWSHSLIHPHKCRWLSVNELKPIKVEQLPPIINLAETIKPPKPPKPQKTPEQIRLEEIRRKNRNEILKLKRKGKIDPFVEQYIEDCMP